MFSAHMAYHPGARPWNGILSQAFWTEAGEPPGEALESQLSEDCLCSSGWRSSWGGGGDRSIAELEAERASAPFTSAESA